MSAENPSVITINPEIMSGTPCFRGTRVPYQILLDYLEGGDTLDEFLDQYPTVTCEAAVVALSQMNHSSLNSDYE